MKFLIMDNIAIVISVSIILKAASHPLSPYLCLYTYLCQGIIDLVLEELQNVRHGVNVCGAPGGDVNIIQRSIEKEYNELVDLPFFGCKIKCTNNQGIQSSADYALLFSIGSWTFRCNNGLGIGLP